MKWIDVNHRLPTKEEGELNILIFDGQEGVHEAEYYNGKFSYPYYGQDMSGQFEDVIKWQPLPLP